MATLPIIMMIPKSKKLASPGLITNIFGQVVKNESKTPKK
jgi:hypothetical protein